jgi:hypothetical protein
MSVVLCALVITVMAVFTKLVLLPDFVQLVDSHEMVCVIYLYHTQYQQPAHAQAQHANMQHGLSNGINASAPSRSQFSLQSSIIERTP